MLGLGTSSPDMHSYTFQIYGSAQSDAPYTETPFSVTRQKASSPYLFFKWLMSPLPPFQDNVLLVDNYALFFSRSFHSGSSGEVIKCILVYPCNSSCTYKNRNVSAITNCPSSNCCQSSWIITPFSSLLQELNTLCDLSGTVIALSTKRLLQVQDLKTLAFVLLTLMFYVYFCPICSQCCWTPNAVGSPPLL